MPWTAPEIELPEQPLTGPERPVLEGFLAWHRALLLRKCAGLTGGELVEPAVPPSNLTLLGLVRHMAKVERRWFRERIGGEQLEPMYPQGFGPHGDDGDFEVLDADRAEEDYARFVEECRLADEALAAASYDDDVESRHGVMSVRAVVIHMVEEYAQHNGHADLLRERIDGTTGA